MAAVVWKLDITVRLWVYMCWHGFCPHKLLGIGFLWNIFRLVNSRLCGYIRWQKQSPILESTTLKARMLIITLSPPPSCLVFWPDQNSNPWSTTLEASMVTITLLPTPPSSLVLTRLFFILRKKHISFSLQI